MWLHDEFQKYTAKYFDGKSIRQSDGLTVVIRGHLLIETALEVLLSQYLDLKVFEDRDLSFDDKLKLAQSMKLLGDLYAPIKRLNKIRNDFAHKIETKIQDVDIEVFVQFIKARKHDDSEIFKTYIEEKQLYLGQIIHYILGCLMGIIERAPN